MRKSIISCFLVLLISSCATVNHFSINVKKPAQVTLPLSVKKIALVNNAGKQPDDTGHKNILTGGKEEAVTVKSDSLNIILVDALAQFMNDEGFYDEVETYDYALRENESFLSLNRIDSSTVGQIADIMDVDAIISLDRLIIMSEQESSNIGDGITIDELRTNINTMFGIYSRNGNLLSPPVQFRDSLHWESFRAGRYLLDEGQELPPREAALRESVLYIADQMVKMFIPYWEEQNRWYYTDGNTQMKKASVKASANEWKDAALIWGELYEKEKKADKKAKLASNIALANEMLDDIENAVNWAKISIDHFVGGKNIDFISKETLNQDVLRTVVYYQELKTRLDDFGTLDVQQGSEFEWSEE